MNDFDDRDENKSKSADLDYWDGLSDEEKQKELNLFTEQRRQESIEKYGRDIYDKERNLDENGHKKVEHEKAIKFRNIIDKIISFYEFWRDPIIVIAALLIALWFFKNVL